MYLQTTVISIVLSTETYSSIYVPVTNTIFTTETHANSVYVHNTNTIFVTETHAAASSAAVSVNTIFSTETAKAVTSAAVVTTAVAITTFAPASFSLITATNTTSLVQQANQTSAPLAFTGDATGSSMNHLWTLVAAGSFALAAVLL
jgi:hypothetical protein